MSYRQFPAIDSNGESRIILEFRSEAAKAAEDSEGTLRYELDDGRPLQRSGRDFVTQGGELRLSL